MYSMTGFGRGEYRENGIELTVEIKTVNNRFLDVSLKCPRVFSPLEDRIRACLREHMALYVDLAAARSYVEAAQAVAREFPLLPDDLTVTGVLRFPDVVRQEEAPDADEGLVTALESALGRAVSALTAMRLAEGERLKRDLLARMGEIAALREKIAARAPLVAEEYRRKLTERIGEYLGGKVEESRILTEAAVFADKCSIDEELTRLAAHIASFYQICESETVGRKLDFLVQEFNRECNTVCSKSNDAELTAYALQMKNEIEKVREQIQNLE